MEQKDEQRKALESANVETLSQHGSNSRQQMVSYIKMPFHSMVLVYKSKFSACTNMIFLCLMQSPRYEEVGEANQHVQGEEDEYAEEDNYDEEPNNEANQQATTPAASPAMNITSPRNDGQRFSHDALVIFSTSHADFILAN